MLKRINGEIEARRRAGEDLPPAPKTAIAGPEYFGFNQPEVRAEALVRTGVMAWPPCSRLVSLWMRFQPLSKRCDSVYTHTAAGQHPRHLSCHSPCTL